MDKTSVADVYKCSSKSQNDRLDETCAEKFVLNETRSCQLFHPAKDVPFSQNLKWIMVTCLAIALVLLILRTSRIYKIWIKNKKDIDGWPMEVMVWIFPMSTFQCFPLRLIYTFLLMKVLVAIPMDYVSIITDALYFYQISSYSKEASCDTSISIIDRRIAIADNIYWTLFVVNMTGILKNIWLMQIAYRKMERKTKNPMMMPTRIRRVDLGESELQDKNAYMEFTFLQGVFAFILQDAVAAFVQFQYVDKYLVHLNMTVFLNASMMSIASLRLMYLFSKYILQYWDTSDRTSLKVLHSIMLFTHMSLVVFQGSRAMLLILTHGFTTQKFLTPLECFEYNDQSGLFVQTPFATGCWTTIDYIFTGSIILASLGVAVCIGLLAVNGYDQFKIFTQSRHFTRPGVVFHAPILAPPKFIESRATHLMSRFSKANFTKKQDVTEDLTQSTLNITTDPIPMTSQKF